MNKIIRLEATIQNFNEAELKAISKAQEAYFIAKMSDDYSCTIREERQAFEELREVIPNVANFIPSFYENKPSVIVLSVPMTPEEVEEAHYKDFESMEYNTGYVYNVDSIEAGFAIKYVERHSNTHIVEYEFGCYVRISRIKEA